MANFFLKSHEKTFRVRRKHYTWFNELFKKKIKKISVYKYIYRWLNKNLDFATKIFIEFTSLKNFFFLKRNFSYGTQKSLLYVYLNYYTDIYKIYVKDFQKKFNIYENNLCVLSYPKKQLFITFIQTTPIFIFSNGMMRVVMGIEDKNKKKSRVVLKNTLKYICVFTNKFYAKQELSIKIIKNYFLISLYFSQYKKFCKNIFLNYILYEPKVKFSFVNNKKRSSIKKNLRKNKKL